MCEKEREREIHKGGYIILLLTQRGVVRERVRERDSE